MVQVLFQNLHETVMCKIMKITIDYDFREEFVYSDGGTIHLDWKWAQSTPRPSIGYSEPLKDSRPIVFLIPGQGNDSDEIYMQN